MPTKKPSPEESKQAQLRVSRSDGDQKLKAQIDKGYALLQREIGNQDQLETAKRDYYSWSEFNGELLRQLFTTEKYAVEYEQWFGIVGGPRSFQEKLEEFKDDVDTKLRRLESIKERLQLIPTLVTEKQSETGLEKKKMTSLNKVFVVHGHDEYAREAVARFLEKLGLDVIVLHERPNEGRTIIEKIESNSDVAYSVVLLTGDDIGAAKVEKDNLQPRARQNVILELGYFLAKLGRSHVSVLYQQGVELPSDFHGVLWIPFDKENGWQLRLAKELKQIGLNVDMNKAL